MQEESGRRTKIHRLRFEILANFQNNGVWEFSMGMGSGVTFLLDM